MVDNQIAFVIEDIDDYMWVENMNFAFTYWNLPFQS